MKVQSVKVIEADGAMQVTDCFVDRGLRVGGHAALPDIDIDFASDRRLEMKEYLEQRYNRHGKQRVFSAGTFTTLKLKAALKDVSRVHRVPLSIVNYISAIIPDEVTDWTGLFRLAYSNRRVAKFVQDYPGVIEDMRVILGQAKAASVHASAVIVTPAERDGCNAECFDFVPLRKMDGLLVSEFDGYSVDEIGLLKNDMLAIKELTKLGKMLEIVNGVYGKRLTIEDIATRELCDEKVYRLFGEGHTQNIFQFSSPGMTRFMADLQPGCIEDLIAGNALYRPATIEIGATDDFVEYKRGNRVPVYDWGTYEATRNTYSIMCYQEQFMQIAHTVGGFDLGKCDYLRKAIGKKRADIMATLREDFISGALGNGCPREEAEEIWRKIELAGKYSFNKSHAAAYALTAYVGAWVKANYPLAFYTVALDFADEGDIPSLMGEMEVVSGAKIVTPDINGSRREFYTDYERNRIFWSLGRIKFLGTAAADYIVREREVNGEFTGIDDFVRRIFRERMRKDKGGKCDVNARHVKQLIVSGCFDAAEGVKSVTERYAILLRAGELLGFDLPEKDFPKGMIDQHYFWSQLQIGACGTGSIDYRRIYDCSDARNGIRGTIRFMSLRDAMTEEYEDRWVAVCASVVRVDEIGYTDKKTGARKMFAKLVLQQNSDTAELVVWDDFLSRNRAVIVGSQDRIVVFTGVIRYSKFAGRNGLQLGARSVFKFV